MSPLLFEVASFVADDSRTCALSENNAGLARQKSKSEREKREEGIEESSSCDNRPKVGIRRSRHTAIDSIREKLELSFMDNNNINKHRVL